jgi:hypothetical protein
LCMNSSKGGKMIADTISTKRRKKQTRLISINLVKKRTHGRIWGTDSTARSDPIDCCVLVQDSSGLVPDFVPVDKKLPQPIQNFEFSSIS